MFLTHVNSNSMRFTVGDRRMHTWLEKYHRIGESFEVEDNRTWIVAQERDRFGRFDTDDRLNKLVEILLSIFRTFSFRNIRLLKHDHEGILIQMLYFYCRL